MATSLQTFAHLGLGAFCLSSLVVGARLARLHLRTGERPELLASIALVCIGPVGFVGSVICASAEAAMPGLGVAIWSIASVALAVGSTAVFGFTRAVFHPTSEAARAALIGAATALAICLVGEGFATGFRAEGAASGFTRTADWIRTGGLLWGGISSLAEFLAARRRLALGLADSSIALRLGLWGIGLVGVGVVGAIDSAVKLVGSPPPGLADGLLLVNACAGLMAATAVHLAFHPGRLTLRLESLFRLRATAPGR